MGEPRRSGRARKSNPKYAQNALEDIELEDAILPQDDSDASSFEQPEIEEEEPDEPDDSDASAEAEAQMISDQEAGDDGDIEIGPPRRVVHGKTFSAEDARELLGHGTEGIKLKRTPSKPKIAQGDESSRYAAKKYEKFREGGLRSRGIMLNPAIMSKETTINEIAGYEETFIPKLQGERHRFSETITLPQKHGNQAGKSGPAIPEMQDEMVREAEKQAFLKWYEQNEGRKVMALAQAVSVVEPEDHHKWASPTRPAQTILLGPYNHQKQFSLGMHESLSVGDAWTTALGTSNNIDLPQRSSWILNLGARITAMAWAPHNNGGYQYLAVSVEAPLPSHIPRVTAMEASQPYQASLQIWAFAVQQEDGRSCIRQDIKPKLVHVVCHKWGSVRRFSWCPAGVAIDEGSNSIGQLAMITHDGYVRIIDICYQQSDSDNPYVNYEKAAFASRPPETNCTCLTWISANQLAVGCGNGYVAIWNIEQCLARAKREIELTGRISSDAMPYWYYPIHASHIISIIGHQPYPCQFFGTNGVDGQIQLTSLRNPYFDKTCGARERHLMAPLVYSVHILGHYEVDELDGIRARCMRHFPIARSVGRGAAQVVCLDAAKTHPSILVGSANGSAMATCPLRRLFIRRLTEARVEAWQQVWFQHEFVPTIRAQILDSATTLEKERGHENYIYPRPGIIRFLEGQNVEIVSLARRVQEIADTIADNAEEEEFGTPEPAKKKSKKSQGSGNKKKAPIWEQKEPDEEVSITIHEEESAVTCICWNPNVETGGWAAAGMATGLLRVEDLAI